MAEVGVVSAYARGWSAFFHWAAELRSSILRQFFISLFVCGLAVAGTLWAELSPEANAAFGDYLRASTIAYVMPTHVVAMEQPTKWTGPADKAVAQWAPFFGGRSVGFLLWQWFLRALVWSVLLAPILTALVIFAGRRMTGDKHRRGSQIEDTTSWDYLHRPQILLASAVAGGAALGLIVAAAYVATPRGMAMLPHLLVAWMATHSEALAALLSPNWDGATIWTPAPVGQLLAPADSYAAVLKVMGGVGLMPITLAGGFGAVLGGYATGLLWQRNAAKAVGDQDPGIMTLGGVPIPRKREVYHFLICGATGSGKSVANTQLLATVRERGQRAIVFDTSGEYIAKFYRPGRDVILNPGDARAAAWTPWADIRRASDALTMGEALFPKGGDKNEFWALAGSSVFAGLLEKLSTWGAQKNSHLAYMVERLGPKQLMDVLKGTVGERFVDPGAKETATSVAMTTAAQLRSFRYLRDPAEDEKPFSIRQFVEDEGADRWMFVVMRDEDAAVMKPLVSLWLDIAISAVLSLPGEDESLPQDKRRRLFVSLDELQALQKLPALDGALLRGRKKGLSVTLGIQSIKGVRAIYGNNEADALMGQPQTQLVLRTPEEGTAKWLEGQLGSAEIERAGESQQVGVDTKQQGGVNLQRSVAQEAAVLASEIQDLPDLVGYLKVVGEPVKRVVYIPGGPKPSCPGFVQAPEIGDPMAPAMWNAMVKVHEAEKMLMAGDVQAAKRELEAAKKLAAGRDAGLEAQIQRLEAA